MIDGVCAFLRYVTWRASAKVRFYSNTKNENLEISVQNQGTKARLRQQRLGPSWPVLYAVCEKFNEISNLVWR